MDAIACFAKGWRTFSAALALVVAGLLSLIGTVDITPVVALIVKDPALLGAAMVFIGLLFGLLRYLTTTPAFSPYASPPPLYRGVDEAPEPKRNVDVGM